MDFIKKCVEDITSIDPSTLSQKEFSIYLTMSKLIEYTIPKKEGKIEYNKEAYGEYCKMFREALKNNTINLEMKTFEIYQKLPYDKLDKWTKINIIKKLSNNEKAPIVKSAYISKIDNDYVNEIIDISQNVMLRVSKLMPLIQLMDSKGLSQEDVMRMIVEKDC